MASLTTSYSTLIAANPGNRIVTVQAHPDNTDNVFIRLKNGGDAAILNARGSVQFQAKEASRGIEGKSESGTQDVQVIY